MPDWPSFPVSLEVIRLKLGKLFKDWVMIDLRHDEAVFLSGKLLGVCRAHALRLSTFKLGDEEKARLREEVRLAEAIVGKIVSNGVLPSSPALARESLCQYGAKEEASA